MGLTVGRIEVGDTEQRAQVRDVLGTLGSPSPSEWRVELGPGADGRSWEVVAEGPRRLRPADPEWHVVLIADAEARYRRLIRAPEEQRPGAIRNVVRQLVWEHIEMRENAVWADDAETADAMENALFDLLSAHELPPLSVRLGTWRGQPGRRYVCKVEAKTLGEGGTPPWRWWSPIFGGTDELAAWLEETLRSRGVRRAQRRAPASRPPVRQPAAAAAVV